MIISTKHDLDFYLSDPDTHDAALDHLQCLLDEQYGYDDSGAWTLLGGGGLERLGLTRAEAVARGAVDRVVAEPAGPDLTTVKDAACARLNAKRDAIQYGIFTDSHGHSYDVDAKGREKMTGLTAMLGATGMALPAGFTWTDADNVERPHDAESFLALTSEILAWTDAVHRAGVAAKASIRSDTVTTAEQVEAIVAGVVWP